MNTKPPHSQPPAALSTATLLSKIAARQAVVGVMGLGYVGLPLVRAVLEAGYEVVGFDIDAEKIRLLKDGTPYLKHLGDELPRMLASSTRFRPTAEAAELAACDIIVLCVPTPLGKHNEPDLTFVRSSTELAAKSMKPGGLLCLESTSYPGTTREVCVPILAGHGLHIGESVFVAFSPEREDPGRRDVSTRTIPRLVGGLDAASGDVAHAFYGSVVERAIRVDSAEIAEAAKLLENIYRSVNIALVNELKPLLADMGIDIWKVIEAAKTKPFGFQPFYPGPGLGGHCIPIDPYYLTWKAREHGHSTRFIELAGEINHRMPHYVIERLGLALNNQGKPVRGSRVLVLGMAYKPNVDDVRETPAAEIITQLVDMGAQVSYHDPHVPVFPGMRKYDLDMASTPLSADAVRNSDAVLIVTDHDGVDYALVGANAKLIVDTRNAMARVKSPVQSVVVKA
jgi:UDP-N-acetyl-D-glucosamine dehydrogenase